MKAAICAIHSKYIHSALAPWCLVAGVQAYAQHPAVCEVIEATINQKPEEVIEKIHQSLSLIHILKC